MVLYAPWCSLVAAIGVLLWNPKMPEVSGRIGMPLISHEHSITAGYPGWP